MIAKKGMAQQYTDISIDEMKQFLKRAFRTLRPEQGAEKGEITFNLKLGPNAGIRVWSSIPQHGSTGKAVGEDAIRVQLYSFTKNRPLMAGKAPIVKRTQGWRDNLRARIEEFMEKYDSKEEDIESGKYIDWTK